MSASEQERSEQHSGLASWFEVAHPRYRWLLGQLLLAGTIGSAFAYVDNYLLTALTDSLGAELGGSPGATEPGVLAQLALERGLSLSVLVLALFVLGRCGAAAIAFWRARAGGALRIKARNDLESEILVHLLRKDDSFFATHSPAETVNRLAVDIARIGERRTSVMTIWWSALLIVGSLLFFLQRDWRLALVGLAACVGGAWWTYRITRNVSGYDRDFLTQDDRVKSQFEDFLRAAPEIQVARLFEGVRARFERRQRGRTRLFHRYVGLRAMLQVANVISSLAAFAVMVGILLWLASGGGGRDALVLVPAVIWTLPRLFENAAELIYIRLDFQLAHTSMERLLQYETLEIAAQADEPAAARAKRGKRHGKKARTAPEPAEPLELANVWYQYTTTEGTLQGGIADVTTSFAPGRWTAIVGGAGSGKSTLLKVLLGRLQPQLGEVRCGARSFFELDAAELASRLALMPQAPALLNTTIRDNVLFGRMAGRRGQLGELSDDDLALVEETGLGRVCRVKALDRLAGEQRLPKRQGARIQQLRKRARALLRAEHGLEVRAYDREAFGPQLWWLEWLLRGRGDRCAVALALLGPKRDGAPLRGLSHTALSRLLAPVGRQVLRDSQSLLRLPTYQRYAQLAPTPLDEPVWQLRSANLHLVDGEATDMVSEAALLAIALTSTPAECGDEAEVERVRHVVEDGGAPSQVAALTPLLGRSWSAFAAQRVHPHLSWRENLIFGALDAASQRVGRATDRTLLELVHGEGLDGWLTRIGLETEVGRQGGNLSGGQGQLVALCRAVLRAAPVLVLDEPTSALDPASRSQVATLLGRLKRDRLIITVSHDPELVRHADEVKLMDAGRLVATGPFAELLASSETFRNVMKQV